MSPCNKLWFTGTSLQQANDEWAVNRGHLAGEAPPIIAFLRTAMLFITVPLEHAVSRIFNAKWAKIRRFVPIQ